MLKKAKEKFDNSEIINTRKTKIKFADTVVINTRKIPVKKSIIKNNEINSVILENISSVSDSTNKLNPIIKKKRTTHSTSTSKKFPIIKKMNSNRITNKSNPIFKEASHENVQKILKSTIKPYSKTKLKSRKKDNQNISKSEKTVIPIPEYYDLPYKYGNTLIRLLAQTPNTLFVYWEVSDTDIENYKQTYGDEFFYKTKPILIVHNLTLNKHYEVEINDFANCWYLNTEDSDCKFEIEFARKLINPSNTSFYSNYNNPKIVNNSNNSISSNNLNNKSYTTIQDIPEYVSIAKSNQLQSPNDHILLDKLNELVAFKDVRNNNVITKNIKSFNCLSNIYQFYKDMYTDIYHEDEILKNPSSQFKF